MANEEWHQKNEALRTTTAKRVNGAFAAFDTRVNMVWPARRMLMAVVLNVTESEIDAAITEMKRVGLLMEFASA